MLNKWMIGILAILISQSVLALNLQGYRFSDSYRYSLLDDSLMEKFPGRYVVTASFGHVHAPFYYSDSNLNNVRDEIIKYNNVLTAGFTYYLHPRLSLGVDLNAINNSVFGETYNTLADTVVKSKWSMLRTDSFSLSLNPQVILPTGQTENFSTMDSVSGSLSTVAEKSFNKLHLLASIGALSSKNNAYVDVDHRQLLLAQLGVSYDVSEKWNVNVEAFRNTPLVDDKLQDEGKYFLTGKYKARENLSTYFGGGLTGWDEVERNTYSVFVGLKFHERMPAAVGAATPVAVATPARKEEMQVAEPRMSDIYFDHAQSSLPDSELRKLDSVIQHLNDSMPLIQRIVIEGHASSPGPASLNQKLSEKRGETVRQYFEKNGLNSDKLAIEAYGETKAIPKDEAKSRKVHFRVQNKESL